MKIFFFKKNEDINLKKTDRQLYQGFFQYDQTVNFLELYKVSWTKKMTRI